MSQDPIWYYEQLGSALSKAATQSWDHIIVDATLDQERVDVIVGCWQAEDEDSVTYIVGVPRLARLIYDLARVLGNDANGYFKKMHFVLKRTGKFDVAFTY